MIPDIRRHAEGAGYEPWLFFRRGLDWRWISWQEGLEAAETLEDRLLELGVAGPMGCPGFLDPRLVLALCATEARERAIVSLGASYFPRELEQEAQDKGCVGFWQLAPPDQGSRIMGELPECLCLPEAGVGTPAPDGSVRWLEMVDSRQRGEGRDIAFLGCGLSPEVERGFIRWTVKTGAALVLESRDDSVAAMVHWSRPTVAALPAQHLASLASGLLPAGQKDRRRLRRLFQRWRWTLVTDLHDKSMAEAHRAQIRELLQLLGVEVLP